MIAAETKRSVNRHLSSKAKKLNFQDCKVIPDLLCVPSAYERLRAQSKMPAISAKMHDVWKCKNFHAPTCKLDNQTKNTYPKR
jgi:hypothetical protein